MDTGPTPHALELTPLEAAELKEQAADRCIAAGDWDAALLALHKAVFFRPDHAPLYAKLADAYWAIGDLKAAMASYRKLFAVDATPPQRVKDQFALLLDLHAYSLLRHGESPAIALAYLSEAIQLNALDETFWLHRSLAHIQAQCFDKALQDVDHCVNLNGHDVEYFVLRAKLQWRLHMHEKATSDIARAARLDPQHPEVIAHEQRLLREAETIYAQACRHVLVHELREAIGCLDKAAEIAADDPRIYLRRAAVYRELGDLATALRDVDKAQSCHARRAPKAPGKGPETGVDATPAFREIATLRHLILNDLALQCLRDRSFQVALNAMNQVIRGDAELQTRFHDVVTNPYFFVNRGDAYRGLGHLQAALADYHHALRMVPDKQDIRSRVALIHYNFGIAFFNQAHFDKAELEFAKAIEHDDEVAVYHVRKGDAARFQEKHAAASRDYERALQLDPQDADTYNKLQQYASSSSHRERLVSRASNQLPQPTESPKALPPNVSSALKTYKSRHKAVQELLQSRPAFPPLRRPPT
ncbi:hypothetical protein P43SY_004914 [Pythium insidiosum]|uniref:Tetratricopeptide repeat protein n=1 Tax=Pythium insidiosum TaxID=114742 RepID=A0AAD5Q8U1_PYTIN|nr:hypothetical protein P43SY_004914 [Pythium insidiosum]